MKLYLAFLNTETLMEGTYETIIGVFDSEQKAWDCLRKTPDFARSEAAGSGRVYHVDGELSYHWSVVEVELNKPVNETFQ